MANIFQWTVLQICKFFVTRFYWVRTYYARFVCKWVICFRHQRSDSLQLFSKMTSFPKESFRKLNKDDLTAIALDLESEMEVSNARNLEELKIINKTFSKLVVDVAVTKDANSLLSPRLVDTERQCWWNVQCSRRDSLEVLGLPKSFSNDEVETKLCRIFQLCQFGLQR